jgi:hypothetical protein
MSLVMGWIYRLLWGLGRLFSRKPKGQKLQTRTNRWGIWICETGGSPEFVGFLRGPKERAEDLGRAAFARKVFMSGKMMFGSFLVVEVTEDGRPITPITEEAVGGQSKEAAT